MPVEAKEFLRQYQDALVDIRNLEAEAEEIETLAMSITVSTDGDRVQSSGKKDRMADLAAKVADLEMEIMDMRTDALNVLQIVERIIAQVEDKDYRQLLHMRYIEKRTWEEIAVSLKKSWRWTCSLHGKALQAVQEIIEKNHATS